MSSYPAQTIDIAQAGRPPLTLAVRDRSRVRFYPTAFSERAAGPGWAPSPSGRYWRLEVPPSVYHALSVGDACGVLWQGEEILGAVDWDAREQPPNALAYQIEAPDDGVDLNAYAGHVVCVADGKPALLGRIEVDPEDEWWLVVPD
jgi:hypothetical protein